MLPTSLLYCLVRDLMAGTTVGRAGFYTTGCIGCFGSLISTTLIALSLFVFDWRMAQAALSRLIRNKTVLIIAHRMRTVAGADQIIVLKDGVVAEQGSSKELYAKNGIYTHMADLQAQGQSWTI